MLQPGARLVQRELSERLNVSRTSLRETPGGLMVSGLSLEEAENAYSIRTVPEALVVRDLTNHAVAAVRGAWPSQRTFQSPRRRRRRTE